MKKALCFLLTTVMVLSLSACSFFSAEKNKEEKLITLQESPDGSYVVCLYQVGNPQWSFGSVGAKLVLKDLNGKKLDEVNFSLANDGAGVYAQNLVTITWSENCVEVLMDADEAPEEYYVLNFGNP